MLEREREPARLRVDAQPGRLADPVRERDVEHLHVHLADVAPHPLLEDVDQEAAVLLAADRAVRDQLSLLLVERPVAPRRPRHLPVGRLGDALDDRDELDEACVALVAQEAVHLAAVVAVARVHGRERVPLDAGRPQMVEPAHHLVERPLAALVDPVGVVHLPRPVDRDPDQEVVLLEERRPLLVEQRRRSSGSCTPPAAPASGTARRARPSGGRTRAPSSSARRPARRSPPPARVACASISCRRYCLEQLVGHPEPRARIEHLLGEEEAVRAVEVADRTRRLREQVERRAAPRQAGRGCPASAHRQQSALITELTHNPSMINAPQTEREPESDRQRVPRQPALAAAEDVRCALAGDDHDGDGTETSAVPTPM